MRTYYSFMAMVLTVMLLASCESFMPQRGVTVKFEIGEPETKAVTTDIADHATKLNVMLFDVEGNKVLSKVISQTNDNAEFGNVHIDVEDGEYILVGVAHSSPTNATITSPSKVSFTLKDGYKITDTYTCCSPITIIDGEDPEGETLIRKSAMVRFIFLDTEVPSEVVKFRFKYTGGSATINPGGTGYTKSTQTETRVKNAQGKYDIYTFPYMSTTGKLQVTIEALDSQDNTLRTRVINDVFVETNFMTEVSGYYFSGGNSTENTYTFGLDPEWAGVHTITF